MSRRHSTKHRQITRKLSRLAWTTRLIGREGSDDRVEEEEGVCIDHGKDLLNDGILTFFINNF
jgi:hypothetical protein